MPQGAFLRPFASTGRLWAHRIPRYDPGIAQCQKGFGGMNTQFWLIQAFNGISYGALLFLVGSGLSLIFGVMRIVNLSHGSYFLLGGYVALTVIWTTGSWLLAL